MVDALADALALALGALDEDAVAFGCALTLADAPGADVDADAEGASGAGPKSGLSRPSHDGNLCPMTMIAPAATTSMSAAMNASSFCSVDGPRLRTTIVGLFGRRGRSAMRIVGCGGSRCTGNGGGVCGYEGEGDAGAA